MAAVNYNELARSLRRFNTDRLSEAWVHQAWENHDVTTFPEDFDVHHQDTDWMEVVTETVEAVNNVLEGHDQVTGDFWTYLNEESQVNFRGIVVVICGLMDNKSSSSPETKEVAVMAASLYLRLCRLPGSNAYRIFSPVLFHKVVDMLDTIRKLIGGSGGGGGDATKKTSVVRSRTGRSTRRLVTRSTRMAEDDEEDEEDEVENLPRSQLMSMSTAWSLMQRLTTDLDQFLCAYALKDSPECVECVAQRCCELLATEEANLVPVASEVLLRLCHPRHGALDASVVTVAKHLCPAVVAGSAATVEVARRLVVDVEGAVPGIRRLLQNVAHRVGDRAEARHRACASIVSVLERFPGAAPRRDFVRWLVRFGAASGRLAHRLLVLEVLAALLATPELDDDDECLLLVGAVVERCSDKAPAVRSKALAIVAANWNRVRRPKDVAFLDMLERRAHEASVYVRQSALLVFQAVAAAEVPGAPQAVEVLEGHCRDVSLLVRKQAMQSLAELLQRAPHNDRIHRAWVDAVLPMVVDSEPTVHARCLEMFEDLILRQVSRDDNEDLAWKLLERIRTSPDAQRYLGRCLASLAAARRLRPDVAEAVGRQVESEEHAASAWMLLASLSAFVPWRRHDRILSYWRRHQEHGDERVLGHVLRVLATSGGAPLDDDLGAALADFRLAPGLVPDLVAVLAVDPDVLARCCRLVTKKSEKFLSSVVLSRRLEASVDEDLVVRHLVTVGELGMRCPHHVPKRVVAILKSFLAPPLPGRRLHQEEEEELESGSGTVISERLRRFAVVALGKLCVVHETLAKDCVPALGRELETSGDPHLRGNIVVIMADLCTRYATLVEEYMPAVTACLRDSSPDVRYQTLVVLTRLLQEDYVKWKGDVFFQFLEALNDACANVRRLARHALVHVLHRRQPSAFAQNFVQCLHHFHGRPGAASTSTDDERRAIYRFLLEYMTDEQRFDATARLCHDVLGAALDGRIRLTTSEGLVRDALVVLASPDIKLASLRAAPRAELDEGGTSTDAALVVARRNIVSQVVKRNAIENIVPIVVSLKHKLEQLRSPLLRELMAYLKELFKDYRNELRDMMAADRQLTDEIEFDIQRFERQQQRPTDVPMVESPIGRDRALPRNVREPKKLEPQRPTDVPMVESSIGRDRALPRNIREPTEARNPQEAPGSGDVPMVTSPPGPANVPGTPRGLPASVQPPEASGPVGDASRINPFVLLTRLDASTLRHSPCKVRSPVVALERLGKQSLASPPPPEVQEHRKLPEDLLRAISTPRSVITNITFGHDHPGASVSPVETPDDAPMLLHVDSPALQRQYRPKRWAVAPSRAKLSLEPAVDSEDP